MAQAAEALVILMKVVPDGYIKIQSESLGRHNCR
jgi:hypothetical protein